MPWVYPAGMKVAVVIAAVLVAGIAGAIVAVSDREIDPVFKVKQENPERLSPVDVERAVVNAPEPAPDKQTRATGARCSPGNEGDIQNPWTCVIRYGSGNRFTFEVDVQADGTFRGANRAGDRRIDGCCVEQPEA